MYTLFFFLALLSPLQAAETALQQIDRELESLTQQLRQMRKEEFNDEMESQPQMLSNWDEFAKKLAEAEENERKVKMIQKRIAELQAQKQTLLHENP
jgi:septal ring factor EnvC (AmiA/AmiB activator)